MRIPSSKSSAPGPASAENDVIAGVLVNSNRLKPAQAQELAARLGVPTPNQITVAVPKPLIDQALPGTRNLLGARPFAQYAINPTAPLSSHWIAPKPATGLTDDEFKALVGVARVASSFVLDHLWQNSTAKLANKAFWIAYDGYNIARSWDDPDTSKLVCVVDASKLALRTVSLADSISLFGSDPLISEDGMTSLTDALSIAGDAVKGVDPAISSLDLWFKQNTRELKKAGNTLEVMHRDTYKVAAKIAEAALSSSPEYKDLRLTPIPHLKNRNISVPEEPQELQ